MMNWIRSHTAQLGLAARICVAAVLTYGLCHMLRIERAEWAVLTSVIVMQASVGAALKATVDRFVGSLGGAIWGVIVSVAMPHGDPVALGVALAVALAPLALLVAMKPAYRIAPVTAIILMLTPALPGTGVFETGLQRMLEIALGSAVALIVSLVIFPTRAHEALTNAAGRALGLLANLTDMLGSGLVGKGDTAAFFRQHDQIRKAIALAETIADEAAREKRINLTSAPDPLPICRTLRRIRHDMTMIGRATPDPLPGDAAALTPATLGAIQAISIFLRETADALASHEPPRSMVAVSDAISAYVAAASALRHDQTASGLSDDMIARIYGIGFAFEQLQRDLGDLVDRTQEFAVRRRR